MPRTKNLPVLANGLCKHVVYTLDSQAVYNSVLNYTFCLHRIAKSVTCESLWLSQVIPECVHRLTHVPGLLDYKEYVVDLQNPFEQLIFSDFPFKVFR